MKSDCIRRLASFFLISILCACAGPTAEPSPPPQGGEIIFEAAPSRLPAGQCAVLRWEAPGGIETRLNGEKVPPGGEQEVCLSESRVFVLEVDRGTSLERRELEITVSSSGNQPERPGGSVSPGRPAYEAQEWIKLGGPPGGLGYDIRMDPTNPEVMFVTDSFAGIQKSTDGGLTWAAVNDGITPDTGPVYKAFSATIDPFDHNTIWIGTQNSGHIYRSTNGGQTWELRDKGLLVTPEVRSVRGITIDPNDPNTVYAGVEVQVFSWSDGSSGYKPRRMGMPSAGEVYQSRDAGATWTRIWQGNNLARYIWVDPRNSNRLYVSTGIFDRDAVDSDIPNGIWGGEGILRSDDAGRTWMVLDQQNGLGGTYIPSLFMHPVDPDTLIAAVTQPTEQGKAGVYVTHDGGDTWEAVLLQPGKLGLEAVEISTTNPQIWYAAAESSIFRSEDAGKTWQSYFMGTAERKSGAPIDLQVDPRDPHRIFVNNYGGGNFVSEDGGQTWEDASNGYSGAIISGLAIAPGDGATLFAGADTGTYRSDDGGLTWQGAGIAAAPALAILAGDHGSTYRIVATSVEQGEVLFSDDGRRWTSSNVTSLDLIPHDMRALAIAPTDPQRMFTGFVRGNCPGMVEMPQLPDCDNKTPGLFRSLDGGQNWQKVAGVPFADAVILSVAIHPDDPQIVYAGTAVGLYKSTDGGGTWSKLDDLTTSAMLTTGTQPNDYSVRGEVVVFDVVFDPSDPQRVLAAAWPGILLRSADGGATWDQIISGIQPAEIIFDILADPLHPGVFYIGTNFSGVLHSTDGGDSWQVTAGGTCHSNLRALVLSEDGSVLYAGSHRSGVWRLGTPGGP